MSTTLTVIGRAVDQCRRLLLGTEELRPLFGAVMPFTGDDLSILSVVERAGSVAFIKRFEQLQDLLSRLVRLIAAWEGADSASMTHRDVGDWLEKRLLVDDAENWMNAVRLRNRLVHEYPILEAEQVRRLNECWALMPALQQIAVALTDYATEKGLVP